MFENTMNGLDQDARQLLKDAQTLLQTAAGLTGEKAEETRQRGMKLLDAALEKAHQTQTRTMEASKQMAITADDYIKEHHWGSIMLAVGVGVLAGVALNRKS